MYFTKLNKRLNISFTDAGYFSSYQHDGKGIFFHAVDNYSENVLSMLPEKFHKDFTVRLMKINASIPPHTDSYMKCGINIYVAPGYCETKFYSKEDSIQGQRLTTQTTGRTFKESELKFEGSFIAEVGDIYLLNILEPHSIKNLTDDPVNREVIVIQTDKYSYKEVRDMLVETGCI
jgi:hypothetical protein